MRAHHGRLSRSTLHATLGICDIWWDLEITPTGLEAVTVTVEGGRECGSTAAVCTSDEREESFTFALSNGR